MFMSRPQLLLGRESVLLRVGGDVDSPLGVVDENFHIVEQFDLCIYMISLK